MKPLGGIRLLKRALHEHGLELSPELEDMFTSWRRTHNDVVFDQYTPEMRAARRNHIITGLPDNYGRGRIIGDYRRVALYGVDAIIAAKKANKLQLARGQESKESKNFITSETNITLYGVTDEISQQIAALEALKVMAQSYGFDIGRPAVDAREAVQWTYLAYLAVLKGIPWKMCISMALRLTRFKSSRTPFCISPQQNTTVLPSPSGGSMRSLTCSSSGTSLLGRSPKPRHRNSLTTS